MESTEGQEQKKLDENPPRVPFGGFSENKKNVLPKRPRTREITSRFMCSNGSSSSTNIGAQISSSAARCTSPIGSRSPDLHQLKRPQPGLRRQGTPYPTESRASITDGHRRPLPEALRSLSVSMQDEKFNSDHHPLKPSLSVVNQVNTTGDGSSSREGTPEKKRPVVSLFRDIGGEQYENARPLDNNVLPKPRSVKPQAHPMSRSVNNNMEKVIRGGQARGRTPKTTNPISRSIGDGGMMPFNAPRLIPLDGRGRSAVLNRSGMQTEEPNQNRQSPPRPLCVDGNTETVDRSSSSESMSSDGSSQTRNSSRKSQESGGQGVVVPARFLQDVNNRIRGTSDVRHSMSETELMPSTSVRGRGTGKLSKSSNQALPPTPSSSGSILTSGPQASISPVKIIPGASSPSRCLPSPTRARGSAMLPPAPTCQSIRSSVTGTVLNLGATADVKKGKKGTNQVEDAHLLRILHNRYLQWRFVNAKAEVVMKTQRVTAEKMLYNMWKTTSELQESVTIKRIELQKARHANKLRSVLSGQQSYLEDWALLEEDHASVLSEAIKNLQAATVRLPITDGVKDNIPEVKEALNSAVNVMDAMSSSVCELLPKVEGTSTLVSELATIAAQEKALLDECAELLATTGELQFEEASLRAQLVQLKRDKSKGIG